ncbi:hypothetical protein I317_03675 [Kwoniella heveanensis CBS 569]|nr:hypothetical protein I317_03675 [Kwoniella heveanensis CBS 569]
MPSSFTLLILATLPLAVLLVPRYIEPYSLLDPIVLNAREEGYEGRQTRWFNMGWWEGTDSFPEAAEALALKLLSFAKEGGYQGGGNVLVIHLNSSSPPKNLHALTSLSLDTYHSKALLRSHSNLIRNTQVQFFTSSAEFKEGGSRASDLEHPLNPMRGFLGEQSVSSRGGEEGQNIFGDTVGEDVAEGELTISEQEGLDNRGGESGPVRYDLVYILDSIYHYKPWIIPFLSTVRPVLQAEARHGGGDDTNLNNSQGKGAGGMIVYTDVIPPSNLPSWKALLISHMMSVPLPNLTRRPSSHAIITAEPSLEAYKSRFEEDGWVDVVVQDWSEGVWPGFAANLKARGGIWGRVGDVVAKAEKEGWKFVAVRARVGSRSGSRQDGRRA